MALLRKVHHMFANLFAAGHGIPLPGEFNFCGISDPTLRYFPVTGRQLIPSGR